jgi:hypothetical protein
MGVAPEEELASAREAPKDESSPSGITPGSAGLGDAIGRMGPRGAAGAGLSVVGVAGAAGAAPGAGVALGAAEGAAGAAVAKVSSRVGGRLAPTRPR